MSFGSNLARTLVLLLIICLLSCNSILAQNSGVRFLQFETKPEISQSTIYDIIQDKSSYLWFATNTGFYKYDGYVFKTYKFKDLSGNLLPFGTVRDLFIDHAGDLWIATDDHGMFKMDQNTEEFINYKNQPGNKNSLGSNAIRSIGEDGNHDMWIGTRYNGIYRFNPKTRIFTQFLHGSKYEKLLDVSRIYKDREGSMWFEENGGFVFKYENNTMVFYKFRGDDPYTIDPNFVRLVERNELDIYLYGKSGHAHLIRGDDFGKKEYSLKILDTGDFLPVQPRMKDADKRFWAANYDKGLFCADVKTGAYNFYAHDAEDNNSILSNQINALIQDKTGNIWIGTTSGVNMLDVVRQHINVFTTYKNEEGKAVKCKNIRAIYADKDSVIWMGTEGEGVAKCSSDGTVRSFLFDDKSNDLYGHNYVNTIYQDSRGMLWIGSPQGFQVFDKVKEQFDKKFFWDKRDKRIHFFPTWSFLEDKNNIMWIGAKDSGLLRYDISTDKFVNFQKKPNDPSSLSASSIWAMLKDQHNTIWLGTNDGIIKLINKNGAISFLNYKKVSAKLAGIKNVWSICEDKNTSTLWFGTSDAQLIKLNELTNEITIYSNDAGIPTASIRTISQDKKRRLWLGTENGIAVFDIFAGKVVKTLNASDGIHSNFINSSCRSANGELYFSGHGGFSYLQPEDLKETTNDIPVVITSFKAAGIEYLKNFKKDSSITLTHDSNNISIDFAYLDFTNPENNKFSYYLKGIDKGWVEAGTRHYVSYSNLEPGKYDFYLRGANSTGIEGKNTLHAIVIIKPAYWQTWWFKASGGTLLAGAVSIFLMSLVRQNREKSKRLRSELALYRAQLNPHFVFNALTSLQYFIMAKKDETALDYLEKLSNLMRLTLENSQQDSISIKEEVIFLNLYFDMQLERFSRKIRFVIDVDQKIDTENEFLPPMTIQPIVENAIKHGQLTLRDDGYVAITILKKETHYLVSVEDNGVGRKAAELRKSEMKKQRSSFGLKVTEEILNIVHGKKDSKNAVRVIDLYEPNGQPRGTRVEIDIPINQWS